MATYYGEHKTQKWQKQQNTKVTPFLSFVDFYFCVFNLWKTQKFFPYLITENMENTKVPQVATIQNVENTKVPISNMENTKVVPYWYWKVLLLCFPYFEITKVSLVTSIENVENTKPFIFKRDKGKESSR